MREDASVISHITDPLQVQLHCSIADIGSRAENPTCGISPCFLQSGGARVLPAPVDDADATTATALTKVDTETRTSELGAACVSLIHTAVCRRTRPENEKNKDVTITPGNRECHGVTLNSHCACDREVSLFNYQISQSMVAPDS